MMKKKKKKQKLKRKRKTQKRIILNQKKNQKVMEKVGKN